MFVYFEESQQFKRDILHKSRYIIISSSISSGHKWNQIRVHDRN